MELTDAEFDKKLDESLTDEPRQAVMNFSFFELTYERVLRVLQQAQSITCHTLNISVTVLYQEPAVQLKVCEAIGNFVSNYDSLEKLDFGHNHVGDEAVIQILRGMWHNRSIYMLDLKVNELTDAIIPHVRDLMERNDTLEALNLSYNKFSDEGRRQLAELSSPHCIVQVKRVPDSPDLVSTKSKKKSKINLFFNYVYVYRNLQMTKQRVRLRFLLRNDLKHLLNTTKLEQIDEEIVNCYIRVTELHPNVINLFDLLKVLEQVVAKYLPDNHGFYLPLFIGYLHSIFGQRLLSDTLSAPQSFLRNTILYDIGSAYYSNLVSQGDPHIHRYSLLVAYICFRNIDNPTQNELSMCFQIYRSLMGINEYITYANASEEERTDFKCLSATALFRCFDQLKDPQQIWDAVPEFDGMLNAYNLQRKVHDAIISRHRQECYPADRLTISC